MSANEQAVAEPVVAEAVETAAVAGEKRKADDVVPTEEGAEDVSKKAKVDDAGVSAPAAGTGEVEQQPAESEIAKGKGKATVADEAEEEPAAADESTLDVDVSNIVTGKRQRKKIDYSSAEAQAAVPQGDDDDDEGDDAEVQPEELGDEGVSGEADDDEEDDEDEEEGEKA